MLPKEKDAMALCRSAIAEKMQWGNPLLWTKKSFRILSEQITEETKVYISPDTLKRVMVGKRISSENYQPQLETKNALARFIGYEDWAMFSEMASGKIDSGFSGLPNLPDPQVNSRNRKILFGLILLAVVVTVIAILRWMEPKESTSSAHAQPWKFELLNPSDTAPFMLKARFSLPAGTPDSFHVFNSYFNEALSPSDSFITDNVFFPIYTWVIVANHDKVLKKIPVHAFSRGWEVVHQVPASFASLRVNRAQYTSSEGLGIKSSWFRQTNQDSLNFDQKILNFKNFNIDCDNFTVELEMTFPKPRHFCTLPTFRFFGSRGHLEFRTSPGHCSQYNFVNLSEVFLQGKHHDLSSISFRYNTPTLFRMEVKNKEMVLWVNGKEAFKGKYRNSAGELKGIQVGLNGFGTLHSFRAWNATGQLVEETDFRLKTQ